MIKSILVLYTILSLAVSLWGEILTEFKIQFEMVRLAIDESQIYIADSSSNTVHIYSIKSYSHTGQFGRKGQGPAEFEYIISIRAYPNYIFVCSGRKVSYFSKNGGFIKSISPSLPTTGGYIPLKSNKKNKKYLPEDPNEDKHKINVELYNSKFKKVKNLYLAELNKLAKYNFKSGKKDILVVNDCFKLDVYEDKLYIGNTTKGFYFIIFDNHGNKLREIDFPYNRCKITSRDKKRIMERIQNELGDQEVNRRKKLYTPIFPEYYPAFSDFIVNDERIYVIPYPVPDNLHELLILDLNGNLIRKAPMPTDLALKPSGNYFIYESTLYYMHYNFETLKWELHADNINQTK